MSYVSHSTEWTSKSLTLIPWIVWKNWTIIEINLTDFLFGASDDSDIKLTSFNCLQSSSSAIGANTLTAIVSLFLRAQENLESKMSEISLEEQSFYVNEKSCFTEWYVKAPYAAARVKLSSSGTVFLK